MIKDSRPTMEEPKSNQAMYKCWYRTNSTELYFPGLSPKPLSNFPQQDHRVSPGAYHIASYIVTRQLENNFTKNMKQSTVPSSGRCAAGQDLLFLREKGFIAQDDKTLGEDEKPGVPHQGHSILGKHSNPPTRSDNPRHPSRELYMRAPVPHLVSVIP